LPTRDDEMPTIDVMPKFIFKFKFEYQNGTSEFKYLTITKYATLNGDPILKLENGKVYYWNIEVDYKYLVSEPITTLDDICAKIVIKNWIGEEIIVN
jgi:hypothetical protein